MLAAKSVATKATMQPRHGCLLTGSRWPLRRTVVRVIQPTSSTSTSTSTSTKEDKVTFQAPADGSGRLQRRGPITAVDIQDYNTVFSSLLKEYSYVVDESWVTGSIPQELYGTYYRNGPGLQVSNPRYQRHTFDGDGMVLSLAFRNGRVHFRNRFVRTEGFVKEQAAGRPLFRNSFTRGSADGSSFFNPFDLSFKNVANTGVLAWGGQLYALWEGGLPYSMDRYTLETRGETRMGGSLRGSTFGAHYRVVSEADGSRRWVAFSSASGFGGAAITFYEFAEDGSLLHETTQPLEGTSIAFVHDVLVSEHYYILVLGPLDFDAAKFATSYVLSQCSIAECLSYNPSKPTKVVLVPRPGRPSGRALEPKVLETAPCFTFHHVNAFEVEPSEGQRPTGPPLVVLDTVAWDEISFNVNQYTFGPEYYQGGSRSHLLRMVCDSATGSVTTHRLLRRTVEFPTTDPRVTGRPHRLIWTGCDMVDDPHFFGPIQAIARLDVSPQIGLSSSTPASTAAAITAGASAKRPGGGDVWTNPRGVAEGVALDVWYAGDRCFPGEPMFVPRPGSSREGDGWLVVVVHNASTEKGEVVVLDAQNLSAGPLATIRLPHRLPAGLHGSWSTEFTGPEDEPVYAAPRWQELGSIRQL